MGIPSSAIRVDPGVFALPKVCTLIINQCAVHSYSHISLLMALIFKSATVVS